MDKTSLFHCYCCVSLSPEPLGLMVQAKACVWNTLLTQLLLSAALDAASSSSPWPLIWTGCQVGFFCSLCWGTVGRSTLLEDAVLSPSFSVLGLHYSHLNVESIFTVQGVRVTPSRLLLGFKTGKRKRVQLFLKSASVDL